MSRLATSLQLDLRLQARNHVYWIVLVVTAFLGLGMRLLWSPEGLRFWMPILTLGGTTATTMLLVGMLMQLERGEGMLQAALLTPLRSWEYLASKTVTLSTLALLEASVFVALAYPAALDLPGFVAAVLLKSLLGVGVGAAVGVRFDSIFRWMPAVILAGLIFDLPNICYLADLWGVPVFWVLPTMPSLALARGAFIPGTPDVWAYGALYGLLVAGIALAWAWRSIERHVMRAELA